MTTWAVFIGGVFAGAAIVNTLWLRAVSRLPAQPKPEGGDRG